MSVTVNARGNYEELGDLAGWDRCSDAVEPHGPVALSATSIKPKSTKPAGQVGVMGLSVSARNAYDFGFAVYVCTESSGRQQYRPIEPVPAAGGNSTTGTWKSQATATSLFEPPSTAKPLVTVVVLGGVCLSPDVISEVKEANDVIAFKLSRSAAPEAIELPSDLRTSTRRRLLCRTACQELRAT